MIVPCRLVTDNDGQFAGLAPVEFKCPQTGREEAFKFAEALVDKVGKGFNGDHHILKVPGVPAGAIDIGLHSSTHNAKFNDGPLSQEQVEQIQSCTDTFAIKVDLTDFKVLVGSPSNDEATGVIGYVGLLITTDSLPEYNRAIAIYDGNSRQDNIAHVNICGWEFKHFSSSLEARAAIWFDRSISLFGLTTADGEKYPIPAGKAFYTSNVFPSLRVAE